MTTERSHPENLTEPGPEESGEDIFAMPQTCTQWRGHALDNMHPRLVENDDGFMVCPVCGCSYGRA
jgi:uncharacterized Zn-finger protein